MSNDNHTRYSTTQVAAAFQVSLETVRIWCTEFERHLSPRANPGHRQKRAFTDEDLSVLALVAELKSDGLTFQDIHVSLDNGERSTAPSIPGDDMDALIPYEAQRQMVQQIQQLESQLKDANAENEHLRQQLDQIRRESLRHEVRAEMLQEQLEKLEARAQKLMEERVRLEREIGSMESDLRRQSEDD